VYVFHLLLGIKHPSALHIQTVVLLQEFIDSGNGHVAGIRSVTVNWTKDETGRWKMEEVPGSEKVFLLI
jgi:NADPH-dependent glutamate synthase beta subunit-like oxidoreductase